mgnify:CR=1
MVDLVAMFIGYFALLVLVAVMLIIFVVAPIGMMIEKALDKSKKWREFRRLKKEQAAGR